MKNRIQEVTLEIINLKRNLYWLWQEKGRLDQEILGLADQIDFLIDEYDQLLLK